MVKVLTSRKCLYYAMTCAVKKHTCQVKHKPIFKLHYAMMANFIIMYILCHQRCPGNLIHDLQECTMHPKFE